MATTKSDSPSEVPEMPQSEQKGYRGVTVLGLIDTLGMIQARFLSEPDTDLPIKFTWEQPTHNDIREGDILTESTYIDGVSVECDRATGAPEKLIITLA